MSRTKQRPPGTMERTLAAAKAAGAGGTQPQWLASHRHRRLVTLAGVVELRLKIRRCHNPACALYQRAIRPEGEGALALPQGEVGLAGSARIGALRDAAHRTVPEIHRALMRRGIVVAARTVSNLLQRYAEFVARHRRDHVRLQEVLRRQGRVILALDGLQPDVGHEVLWVLRDWLSGAVLRARSLLSSTQADRAVLLRAVEMALPAPIHAVVSDGQPSIRGAVPAALPGVPHQLCQFH